MIDLNSGVHNQILTMAIVESHLGSKILSEARKVGVTGGTIFLGRGTVRNPILKALGLDEAKKEILLMITPYHLEEKIHEHLAKKFHMDKPNHGIILTINVNQVFGLHSLPNKDSDGGGDSKVKYEAIFTIVERGQGQEVVDAATAAGSTGATIINARGSGIHEHEKFFAMEIEPEKEIVMIIIQSDKVDKIIEAIEKTMHITDPGKGILFTMGVNRVTGLFQGK